MTKDDDGGPASARRYALEFAAALGLLGTILLLGSFAQLVWG